MKRACALIANRGAGSFSEERLKRIDLMLRQGGIQAEILLGADFAAMASMAREFSRTHEDPLVIAAGGDGTVNAILNGLAGSTATAALLPLGTANVLALELGMPTPEDAVARIVAGRSRTFTAGVISTGDRTTRFFLMAGIGVDGAIVQRVSLREKRVLGKGAYALAALRQACNWETDELSVIAGDESFTCHSLLLCNAARYGGPFIMAPEANIFSPSLELIAIRTSSRLGYLRLLSGILRGNAGRNPDILHLRTDRVRIDGRKPVQADGDLLGISPVDVSSERDFLKIIV